MPDSSTTRRWMAHPRRKVAAHNNAELAELLGLKSATAYDLVKRAHLETMIIDRRIRVVNDSFESWYAGQNHYIKIAERSC